MRMLLKFGRNSNFFLAKTHKQENLCNEDGVIHTIYLLKKISALYR